MSSRVFLSQRQLTSTLASIRYMHVDHYLHSSSTPLPILFKMGSDTFNRKPPRPRNPSLPDSTENQIPLLLPDADTPVNEVHFAFLDGAPETPTSASLRQSIPSYIHRPQTFPTQNTPVPPHPLQHLAGAGAPTSVRNLARILAFLVLLGIIPSTIIFLVDISVHNISHLREKLAAGQVVPAPAGLPLYLITGLALCLLSTAVCHIWSTEAEGSGIPAMKSLMSGFYDKVKPSLSAWALLAKAVGLICAISGGLPVGWEGPNVHISCIIAHHLSRLPPFRALRRDRALRMQIMSCACAVGLASSFGTPIGGVLYALETTSSFYLVPTFWKCVLATLAGSLVYDLLYKTPLVEAFDNTTFEAGDYTREQLFAFILLGVLLGVLGAFFVHCVHKVYTIRKRRLTGTNRYVLLSVVGLVAAVLQYPQELFRRDPRVAINELFSSDSMPSLSKLDLIWLVLIKFPLIVVSIGLPIPAGVFIPCFLLGAGLGRLYGEVLRSLFGSNIVPGGYAVVGAAAFTAGVTRALSVAVVIFEVTGQLKHSVPTLAAVLASVIVANGINRSLYDALIIMKDLPYMPHLRRDRAPAQKVHQVMRTDVVSLQEKITFGEIRVALDTYTNFDSFPVVTGAGLLLGSIRRRSLLNLLNSSRSIPPPMREPTANRRSAPMTLVSSNSMIHENSDSILENGQNALQTETDLSEQQTFLKEPENGRVDQENNANGAEYGRSTITRLEPDLSPLVVTENTTLSQLHFMFVMLMPTHAYVLIGGVLQGIVTRGDIVQSGTILETIEEPPLEERLAT